MTFQGDSRATPDPAPRSAGKLVQHNAACLGTATFLANNHEEQLTLENGLIAKRFRRDSTARRPTYHRGRTQHSAVAGAALPSYVASRPVASSCSADGALGSAPSSCIMAPSSRMGNFTASRSGFVQRKRAAANSAHELRKMIDDETALARCPADKSLQPAGGPSAAERIARVRARVPTRT